MNFMRMSLFERLFRPIPLPPWERVARLACRQICETKEKHKVLKYYQIRQFKVIF